jgi:hypothetical protein
MLGADASGLELRNLAHYMAQYDNGAYGKIILEGDIHTENRKALGSHRPAGQQRPRHGEDIHLRLPVRRWRREARQHRRTTRVTGRDRSEIGAQLRKNFEGNTPALKYLVDCGEEEDEGARLPDACSTDAERTCVTSTQRSTRCCKVQEQSSASGGLSPSHAQMTEGVRTTRLARSIGPRCFGVTMKYKSLFENSIAERASAHRCRSHRTDDRPLQVPVSAHRRSQARRELG